MFAALKYLKISLLVLILFSSASLLYSFVRYFKPADVSKKNRRHFPVADWLDLLFIALLIYITGGVKSFFHVAYVMPICGGIMRFGRGAGIISYVVALGAAGLMHFIGTSNSSAPLFIHIIAGMGTLAFVAWMMDLLAGRESKLRNEIYLSSITDQLSGLYNSSYLRARIKEEVERCSRENTTFALSFIDLDNFKLVNDRHGHLVGDEVLRQVADIFTESIRKSDVVARYGGDEFVLFMPKTGKEQAEKIMQRVEEAIIASTFLKNVKISLSSGIAVCPKDGNTLDNLLTAADMRMYKKKKQDAPVSYPGGQTGYQPP